MSAGRVSAAKRVPRAVGSPVTGCAGQGADCLPLSLEAHIVWFHCFELARASRGWLEEVGKWIWIIGARHEAS